MLYLLILRMQTGPSIPCSPNGGQTGQKLSVQWLITTKPVQADSHAVQNNTLLALFMHSLLHGYCLHISYALLSLPFVVSRTYF